MPWVEALSLTRLSQEWKTASRRIGSAQTAITIERNRFCSAQAPRGHMLNSSALPAKIRYRSITKDSRKVLHGLELNQLSHPPEKDAPGAEHPSSGSKRLK